MMKRVLGSLVVAALAVNAQAVDINVNLSLSPSGNPANPAGTYDPGEVANLLVNLSSTAPIGGAGAEINFGQIELSVGGDRMMEDNPDAPGFPLITPHLGVNNSPNLINGTLVEPVQIPGSDPLVHVDVTILAASAATSFSLGAPAQPNAQTRDAFDVNITLASMPGVYTIDALGPCPDPDQTSTQFNSEDGLTQYNNCDADAANGVGGGILTYTIIPEPTSLGLLALGVVAALRRRS